MPDKGARDGGTAEVPKVFSKIDREDAVAIRAMLDDAVIDMRLVGMGTNQIGVGFKIGLTAFALQAAGLDHRDKSLSGPLNVAIDRCINETVAGFKALRSEAFQ